MRSDQAAEATPILEMNTTPLIDVMLVLLVMLIITIPLQSHAVKMDLPSGPPLPVELRSDRNKLVITSAGGLRWNGEAIGKADLRIALQASADLYPEPELHLQPDAAAPYAVVDEVLAMTKRAQVTRVGFVGNEAYSQF